VEEQLEDFFHFAIFEILQGPYLRHADVFRQALTPGAAQIKDRSHHQRAILVAFFFNELGDFDISQSDEEARIVGLIDQASRTGLVVSLLAARVFFYLFSARLLSRRWERALSLLQGVAWQLELLFLTLRSFLLFVRHHDGYVILQLQLLEGAKDIG